MQDRKRDTDVQNRLLDSVGEGEGGMGWGTHVNPWLIHVNVWQKPLQYSKVISLKLIKKKNPNIQKPKIMAFGPITSRQVEGRTWQQAQIFFSWAPKSLWTVTAAMKLKDTRSWEEKP